MPQGAISPREFLRASIGIRDSATHLYRRPQPRTIATVFEKGMIVRFAVDRADIESDEARLEYTLAQAGQVFGVREIRLDSDVPPGLGVLVGLLSQGYPFTAFRVHPGLFSSVPFGNFVLGHSLLLRSELQSVRVFAPGVWRKRHVESVGGLREADLICGAKQLNVADGDGTALMRAS
jgi:hypothetical protein